MKTRGKVRSKGRDQRPQFDKLLKAVTRGEFDLIASWSVGRLRRSLTDLLGFLSEIHAKHCDLFLHQQGIDTSTPGGKAMFQMMGVFAEFERGMIVERVKAGLVRAKKNCTKSGRAIGRPTVEPGVEDQIRTLRAEGPGMVKIAKQLGRGVSVVQRIVNASEHV